MQLTLDNALWAGCMGSFGIVSFFLKRLIDDIKHNSHQVTEIGIKMERVVLMEKKIDALEQLMYNMSKEVTSLKTELKWMKKPVSRKH
jgi:hypothetical protein